MLDKTLDKNNDKKFLTTISGPAKLKMCFKKGHFYFFVKVASRGGTILEHFAEPLLEPM